MSSPGSRSEVLSGHALGADWELWDTESGNLVGWRESEAEVLALIRELVGKGWPVGVLALTVEDETLPVAALPPAVTGDELARRAEAAGRGRCRTA